MCIRDRVVPAKVVIYNNGTTPVTGFTVSLNLNGPTVLTNILPYTNTLAPFRTDTLTFPDYTFMFTGPFNVRAIISQAGPDDILSLIHI